METALPTNARTPEGRHKVFAADEHDPAIAARLFDEVLASTLNVVTLYTRHAQAVVDQLRVFARRTAQTIYFFLPDTGLTSLREDDIVVPGSKRLLDAVKQISLTPHFGVYVFLNVGESLTSPLVAQLRTFSRLRTAGAERRVVLLEEKLDLPASLGDHCQHLLHQPRSAGRVRLRDGRWVR